MSNDNVTRGRCLCGAIRFEFVGPANWVGHCHCESCRRNTSSPITTFVGVPRSAFRFTGGTAKAYESSPGVRRHFCGDCGVPMAFDADHYPDEIHLYVASLDDPAALQPEFHVYVGEQLPWFEVQDELARYKAGSTNHEPMRFGPKPNPHR